MKSFIVALVIVCVAAIAGTIIYLDSQKTLPVSVPVAETSPEQTGKITVPKQEQPPTISANANEAAQIPATNPVPENLPQETNDVLNKAIDALISPQTSLKDKKALVEQLKNAGELDQAIAELKQRAVSNPNDPEIPTTLGELDLGELQTVQDPNEKGILALEADQYFNTALNIDPANWDAQFAKASALAGWPVELNKGPAVIQQLSSLIDQQETMPPQSQFAQTYVVLGDEYQKLGQPDKAVATWQLGLTKFPDNSTLQKRINSPPAQE